jgi:hypothetical protein
VAQQFYRQPLSYDFHAFHEAGLLAHAPGEITDCVESSGGVSFSVQTWSSEPTSLLVNGFTQEPRIQLNGKDVPIANPHQYDAGGGLLELRLQGTARIQITLTE